MAYDPDPNATYDPVTGTVVPTVWLDLLNANFAEIGAAWTSYTPTWAGSGSAPDIGNGTIAGAYKLLGKLLFVRIRVVMGSSTTYGSGTYFFTLPASLTGASGVEQTMSGKAYDSSLGANHPLVGFVQPASPSNTVAVDRYTVDEPVAGLVYA